MSESEQIVKVRITGRLFKIKSNSDKHAERIREVAQFVDQKIQQMCKEHPALSPINILTMCAMEIYDKLLTEKLKHGLQQNIVFK